MSIERDFKYRQASALCGILLFTAVLSGCDVTRAGYPTCTSRDAADQFKKLFDESQYARNMNLTVVDVVDQRKISESPNGEKLVCQATLMLNNANKESFKFTFTPAKDGEFYVEGEPVQ